MDDMDWEPSADLGASVVVKPVDQLRINVGVFSINPHRMTSVTTAPSVLPAPGMRHISWPLHREARSH